MSEYVPSGSALPLNPNIKCLEPSATVAINDRSNALRAQGADIFKLGLGQSPFPVPEVVAQALRDNAHEKDYLPASGLWALREAVADHHRRVDDVDLSPEGVLIGPGSKELMYLLQLCYRAELILPAPCWVSYAPQAAIVGRDVKIMSTRYEDQWRLTPELLEATCRAELNRPRLLILTYPNNPTGGTYTDDQLKDLANVARRHELVLLSDEIYGSVHHQGAHRSIARHYPEGTIVSGGLSKWCGAGGWRLGSFLFPESLYWLRDAMATVATETFTSVSAPIQHAAIPAFQGGAEIDAYLDASRRLLRALGHWCEGQLRDTGARIAPTEGGFYLFPDFTPLKSRIAQQRSIRTSDDFCRRLLDDTGVAILPGTCFGRPASEWTVRLAYVNFDGKAAIEAVQGVDTVTDDLLRALCPRTMTAIERLCEWVA
jgi:aspartate aminotransferase